MQKHPFVLKSLLFGLLLGVLDLAQAGIPIQHWTQANGAAVWLVESPTVPMVDVRVDFDAGSRRDPVQQAGLASVSAAMMSKGLKAVSDAAGLSKDGVGYNAALDENALGQAWADLGASFGGEASADRVSFSLRSLTYPDLLARAVTLAARQLADPAWPADVWARERERLVAALREANTKPATVVSRAFRQAVYGTHPYGYERDEQTLAHIDVADMHAWHARYLQPCRARVSIVGAVSRTQAQALVTQLLARLNESSKMTEPTATASSGTSPCAPLPAVSEVAPLKSLLGASAEQHIAFESAQAHVLMGQPGFKRDDPDFFALTVGNYILGGGGFVSRLTDEVREKRGLSYSVSSHFNPGLHAGAFTVGLQTRPDQADQAVRVAREVVRRFVAEGPTPAEVKAAKNNLIGGFALRIDNNRKLLDNVANIAAHGLPLNYLDTWTQQVGKVTVADIKAAFARTLQPDAMVTVVVGGTHGK